MSSISPDRSSNEDVDDLLYLNYGSYSAGNTPEPGSMSALDIHGPHRSHLMLNGSCSEGTTPEPSILPSFAMNGRDVPSYGGSFSAVASPEPMGLLAHSLGAIGSGLYSPNRLRSILSPAMVGETPQSGELGDVVTQITSNLRKLADMIEKNGYQGASMSSPNASPSPQPTTPSFPSSLSTNFGEGIFPLNEVAMKNIHNLAHIAANGETVNLPAIPSPSPTGFESMSGTPTPTGYPIRQGKVNIMQIRCKFGQLGSTKVSTARKLKCLAYAIDIFWRILLTQS